MKQTPILNWLIPVLLLLVLFSAGVGLFYQTEDNAFTVTSVRGAEVEIYGRGLYRYDTRFQAPLSRGTDLVMLAVAMPLVAAAFVLYRRGTLRGALLLVGALVLPLYYAISVSFGTAYNPLILVYILMLSAAFFALILAARSLDLKTLPAYIQPGMPHRGLSIFLMVSGIALALVWLSSILGPLFSGQPPAELGTYTTVITYAIDMGLLTPILIVNGLLVRRRDPFGYLLAAGMLVLCVEIGLIVVSQTIFQRAEGVLLNPAQMAIFVGSFVVLMAFALWLLVLFFRNISEKTAAKGTGKKK